MFDGISGANLIRKEKGQHEISAAVPVNRLARSVAAKRKVGWWDTYSARRQATCAAIDETGAVAKFYVVLKGPCIFPEEGLWINPNIVLGFA